MMFLILPGLSPNSPMKRIADLINSDNLSLSELLVECLDGVKEQGDVMVLKADGERESGWYTVFINQIGKEPTMIRSDGDDLKDTILTVLKNYLESNK